MAWVFAIFIQERTPIPDESSETNKPNFCYSYTQFNQTARMKTKNLRYLPLVLLAFCWGCKDGTPDPLKPRIISLKFPGIPVENVSIDQKNLVITIEVPSLLPADIEPEVTLTDQAELSPTPWNFIFTSIRPEDRQIKLGYTGMEGYIPFATYTVKLIPKAPLKIGTIVSPIEYELYDGQNDEILIPFSNLYGNELPVTLIFTDQSSKEVFEFENTPETTHLFAGLHTQVNQLRVKMYPLAIPPGSYDLEFVTKKGETLKIPQPVILKKGPVDLDWAGAIFSSKVQPGETLVIKGRNIFAEDVTMELIDSTGQALKLSNLKYNKFGNELQVPIPASLPLGHYVLRFSSPTLPFVNETSSQSVCRRLYIRKQGKVPYEILFLNETYATCSINGPIVVSRNTRIPTQVGGFEAKVRLRMISVGNADMIQYAQATVLRSGNLEVGSYVLIPNEVPTGQYRVSLQVIDDAGKVTQEGPTYWRVVEVR